MPKQITNSSLKNAGLSKKQAAKLAELNARDDFERQWAMSDLTSPEKVGLSTEHANLVCDKLREAYIKNVILAEDETDEDDVEFDEDKDEDSVEDDIEFSKPEDSDEQEITEEPSGKKSPFIQNELDSDIPEIKNTPAEELGMGDLEDELGESEDGLGFPSDENIVKEDEDVLTPSPIGEETLDTIDEDSMSLEPGQDEIIIEIPGGQKIKLELLPDNLPDNLPENQPEENIMAATKTNSVQERKAQRREIIANLIQKAAELEQIKPGSQPGSHKNLGDDTSTAFSKSKDFVKEEATRGVANPGLQGEKMTLENSGGNSLLSNPNFSPNKVPTLNTDFIANNPNAYDVNSFNGAQSGSVFTQTMDSTENKIPTMGDKDALWGNKEMEMGFIPPSQLDSTTQRRTNVLASKDIECASCYNEDDSPLSVVACNDCGQEYILCSHCIDDIEKDEDECPVCASLKEENIKAADINWDAYCKDSKQREEVCEDNRGDGDVNNDGGFRAKRTEDDDMGDGNYDLEVNASIKMKQLEKENQDLQLTLAKFAKAIETATIMAQGETIDISEIPGQVSKFMNDKTINASALEHVKQTVTALARKNSQMKLAGIEKGMKKGASAPKVTSAGFGYNPNPSQERQFDHITDMKESLKNIFTCPKPNDFE